MRSGHPSQSNHTQPLFVFLLVILAWAPLPLGSNMPWAWHLLEVLVFSLAGLWLVSFYRGHAKLTPSCMMAWPMLTALLLVQLWVLVQILAQWSASPYDSMAAFYKGTAFSLLFALTLLLVDTRERLKTLALMMIACGTFQAFYGGVMTLSGLEYSFFVEKVYARGLATGTFTTRAHLAGFLVMCLSVGIGYMMSTLHRGRSGSWRERSRRLISTLLSSKFLVRLALAIMVVGLVLTRSRMGNSAFFIALTVCGFLGLFLQRKATRNTVILLVSLLAIDAVIVGNWFGIDKVVERLENTTAQAAVRDEVARDTLTMWQAHPMKGVGAGSFYAVFPNYQQADVNDYFIHAHNDYLEFISEYGLVGFGLLGFVVLSSLWQGVQAQRERNSGLMKGMGFACMMSITAMLIHATVDFNLQIPANAAWFMVILALGWIARYAGKTPRSG